MAIQKQWVLAALERIKTGVILLSGQGYPLFINRAANRLMSDCGCVIADDGLLLAGVTDTLRLHRLITDAAAFACGRNRQPGGSLDLTLQGYSIRMQIVPLSHDLADQPLGTDLSESCVAVFISTTGNNQLHRHGLIRQYGLTPAEARLAVLLAEGIDVETAAQQLSVSIQTIRSQLKSVFAKTNVSRQAELVARLLSNLLLESTVEPIHRIDL